MPVVVVRWDEVAEKVKKLENLHEVIQVFDAPTGAAILYRKKRKVETRKVESR